MAVMLLAEGMLWAQAAPQLAEVFAQARHAVLAAKPCGAAFARPDRVIAAIHKHLQEIELSREAKCITSSARMLDVLRQEGIPAQRFMVAQKLAIARSAGAIQILDVHYFVVVPADVPERELIIDGTYLQFFKQGAATDLPELFVGTRAQLKDIFLRRSAELARHAPALEPAALVEQLYGFGHAEGQRRSSVSWKTDQPAVP